MALTPLETMAIDSKWGEATISVGEEKYLATDAIYDNIDKLSTNRFVSCNWSSESSSVHIISSDRHGCWIEGVRECTNVKVTCKFTYETDWGYAWIATTVNGYYLVTVKNNGPICVSSITLNASSITLNLNSNVNTKQLSVESILPANATNKTVSWFSSNESVATVSSNGLVTAKSEGSATITCKANDECGVYTTCAVIVANQIPVEGITLNYTSLDMEIGDTKSLVATVLPSNATNKSVSWESNKEWVAIVDENGVVTAKSGGNATITCKAKDGSGKTATCNVNVSNYFTEKTVEGVEMKFYKNEYECFVAGLIDNNTTGPITIPEEVRGLKVTKIRLQSFMDCKGITKVLIPQTVTEIEHWAFWGCTSLESVSLGGGVKKLSYSVFRDCTSLTTITGLNQLEQAENDCFKGTPWFDNLPDGLIYLGKMLYQYKGTMPDNTTINVKDGTKSISNGAFTDCTGLVGINIPGSVTSIGWSSNFEECTNLASITVSPDNEVFDSRDNCNAIIETATNTLLAGCNTTTIPNSVTKIGRYVFNDSGIKSIVIPNSVESIRDYCFYSCDSLTNVTIGKNLNYIGSSSFQFCPKLKVSVSSENPYYDSRDNCNCLIETATNKLIAGSMPNTIPSSVKTIGEYAFSGSASVIRIPSGVEKIEKSAFRIYDLEGLVIGKDVKEIAEGAFSSSSLKTIVSMADFPTDIHEKAFSKWTSDDKVYENATLFVPIDSKINYMLSTGWNKFKNIVEFNPATTDPIQQGVEGVMADETTKVNVYSLSGQKLAAPKKGINIVGGRKVVVK